MLSLRQCELCKLNCAAGVRWILRLSALAGFGFMNYIWYPLSSDPPKITTMRLVERTSTSLSLSWDVSPRPRVHSPPIRYELTYRKKVRCSCFFLQFCSLLTLYVTCRLYFISFFFNISISYLMYCHWYCNWAELSHCLKICEYTKVTFPL